MTENSKPYGVWPLEQLRPHHRNPRGPIDPSSVLELAESMEGLGLLQPIVITPDGRVVAGHRRLAAAKLLGWETIAVTVRADLTELEQIVAMTVENLQRADLSPLAEARAFRALLDEGLTVADIVRRTGVGRSRIDASLRLLDLDAETAELADRGDLPMGAIGLLARVTDPVRRRELAAEVADYRLSVHGLAQKVAAITSGRDGEAKASRALSVVKSQPPAAAGRECGLECRDRLERLTAALAALARAEATIRRELGNGYVPQRPAVIAEGGRRVS